MIELRFVGDRPDDVAGVEAEGCSECRECCDEHRDDDFQNLFSVHSWLVFKSGAKVQQKNEATKKWGSVRGSMNRLFNRKVVASVLGEGFSLVEG